MTKRWRRIGLISVLAVGLAAIFMFGPSKVPRFADSIPFLKGIPSERSQSFYTTRLIPMTKAGAGPAYDQDFVAFIDTFRLNAPYDEVSRRAQQELSDRVRVTTTTQGETEILINTTDPSTSATINIAKTYGGGAVVQVRQAREASWIERARNWVTSLFTGESKKSPGAPVYVIR